MFGYAEQPNFPPRYNVAPTQPIPIVRLDEGKRAFALVRWGFLPSWVKDPRTFSLLDQCARRIRRSTSRPSATPCGGGAALFRPTAFTNGATRARGGRFSCGRRPAVRSPLPGLWETWTGPNGEEVDTAAIVTTRSNRSLAAIHDRMPVIVPPEAFNLWLDCAAVDATTAAALFVPASDALLESYEVSNAVNRAANDLPELIAPAPASVDNGADAAAADAPADPEKADKQLSLF